MTEDVTNDSTGVENRPYHHGNLREALVTKGLKVLAQTKSDDFSLREVARSVGVSATSIYRHFPDKQAYIEALCDEGSKMLAAIQRDVMASAGGGQEGLDATGLAFVRFALDNPALFRLMFRARPSGMSYGDGDSPAMQELVSNVSTLLPDDATAQERNIRALHAWSVVRGVAMLVLEGQIPDDDELILAVIRTPHP